MLNTPDEPAICSLKSNTWAISQIETLSKSGYFVTFGKPTCPAQWSIFCKLLFLTLVFLTQERKRFEIAPIRLGSRQLQTNLFMCQTCRCDLVGWKLPKTPIFLIVLYLVFELNANHYNHHPTYSDLLFFIYKRHIHSHSVVTLKISCLLSIIYHIIVVSV